MKIIVTSTKDHASMTIKQELLNNYDFQEDKPYNNNKTYIFNNIQLITIDTELLYSDELNETFSPEQYIMASCHKAKSNRPSLLVHTPGNWTTDNEYGGMPQEVGIANPNFIKNTLIELQNQKDKNKLEYDVSLEVTHHGPTNLDAPTTFVELGSTQKEWQDNNAANAVSIAIMNALATNSTHQPVLGAGGNHYANRFNELLFRSKHTVSHIIPKHAIDDLTIDIFSHALARSSSKPMICCLDWKGMNSSQRKKIISYCDELNLPYKKVKELIN